MDHRLSHLDALRGFAIVLVVGIHARGYVGPLSTPADRVWAAVATVAVPAFFLCDGYLFARAQGRLNPFNYPAYLGKSARRLLVPWLIFSLLYLALRAAAEAAGVLHDRMVVGRPASAVARDLYESRIAMQMYFLPSLFLIRALAFAVRPISLGPGWGVALAFAASVALRKTLAPTLGSDPVTNALGGFQYYLIGVFLFKYEPFIKDHAWGVFASLSLSAATALAWSEAFPPTHARLVYQCTYLAAAYVFCLTFARAGGPLARVGRRTMGVYLLHGPVLLKVVDTAVSARVRNPITAFLVVWAVTFAASLALARAVTLTRGGRVLLGEA